MIKEVYSEIIEMYKKYEIDKIDSDYFLYALDVLKVDYPEKDYKYTRFFQELNGKVFMHIRIILKDI